MNSNFLSLLKRSLYNGFLIPVVYLILMSFVSFQYHLFADWDACMHYFSGIDIYQGNGYNGWASHFWPPLYPVLTGLLAKLTPAFEITKLISVVSASLLLLVVYKFVYKLSANNKVACLAQLLMVTNSLFIQLSIQIENHMLDSLFYVWAILLLLQNLDKGKPLNYFFIGIVCGLAGLTRYTSYSLLPAFVLTLFFFYPFRRAIGYASCIALGFALISSPWWTVNYLNNGSPFASWQYMNVGLGVFQSLRHRWTWCWEGINGFNSVFDIFRHAPWAYTVNFFRNILKSFAWIIYRGQTAGLLCSIAVILFIYYNYYKKKISLLRAKNFLPVLISFVCYLALVSQAFVFSEVFLSWLVLIVIYGTFALYELFPLFYRIKPAYKWGIIIAIAMGTCFDLTNGTRQLKFYLYKDHGVEENLQIGAALKSVDNNIGEKVIMCFHPARAYYLGCRYLMLPLYYKGDLNGLISYKNMSYKVREQSPRYPSTISINDVKINYLVYDVRAAICLPQFSFLLEKGNPRIPKNFQLVYLSNKVAVYKVVAYPTK